MASKVRRLFRSHSKSRPASGEDMQVYEWTKNDEKLLQSAKKGDLTRVQSCLKKGIDPMKVDPNHGVTALHEAAGAGNKDVIDSLVKVANVDIDVRDGSGKTPLHWAVSKKQSETVVQLLALGSDSSLVDHDNMSAMHHACTGNMDCVILLIKHKAPVDLQDMLGRTPLTFATAHGQASVCKLLLENGADVNNIDVHNNTPLMAAAKHGNAQLCQFLLDKGADPTVVNNKGKTALQHAINKGHIDVKKVLEKATVDQVRPAGGTITRRAPPAPTAGQSVKGQAPRPLSGANSDRGNEDRNEMIAEENRRVEEFMKRPADEASADVRDNPSDTKYYGVPDSSSEENDSEQEDIVMGGNVFPHHAVSNNTNQSPDTVDQPHIYEPYQDKSGAKDVIPRDAEIFRVASASTDLQQLRAILVRERNLKPGDDIVSAIQEIVTENDTLKNENEDHLTSLENLKAENRNCRDLLENKDRIISDYKERLQATESDARNLQELLAARPQTSAAVDPQLLADIEHLRNENDRLADELAEQKESSDRALRELGLQLEGYGKLAVDKDIISRELETMRLMQREHERERHAKLAELDQMRRDYEEIQSNVVRHRAVIAERDNQYLDLKQAYEMTKMENEGLNKEISSLTASMESGHLRHASDEDNERKFRQNLEDQLAKLRVEISEVRFQLENKILECGTHVDQNKEHKKLIAQLENERKESDATIDRLNRQIKDYDKKLALQVDGFNSSLRNFDETQKTDLKQLGAENERLIRELQDAKAQIKEVEKNHEVAILSFKAGVKDLKERSFQQETAMKQMKSDKDRELNKLIAENEYLNREITLLRLAKHEPKQSEPADKVQVQTSGLLKSEPGSNIGGTGGTNGPSSGVDDEVEKKWHAIENRRESGNWQDPSDQHRNLDSNDERLDNLSDELHSMKDRYEQTLFFNANLKQHIVELEKEIRGLKNALAEQSMYLSQFDDAEFPVKPIHLQQNGIEHKTSKTVLNFPHGTNRKDMEELSRTRIEIGQLRNELEHGALEKDKLQNSRPTSQKTPFLALPLETSGNERKELEKLRAEIVEVRNELEKVVLDREKLKQELQTMDGKHAPVNISGKDDNEVQKLRVENSEIRLELEKRVLENSEQKKIAHEPEAVVREKQALLQTVPMNGEHLGTTSSLELKPKEINELKQLRAENSEVRHELEGVILEKEKLLRDLEKAKALTVSRRDPQKEADELAKVRAETAAVRQELERAVLDKEELKQALQRSESKKLVAIPQHDSDKERDELAKVRAENAEIRLELERLILDRENTKQVVCEPNNVVLGTQVLLQTTPLPVNGGDIATSPSQLKSEESDKLKNLRVENSELRHDLEKIILEKEALFCDLEKTKSLTLSRKENPRENDEMAKLRAENVAIRQEMEKAVLDKEELKQGIQKVESKKSFAVPYHDINKENNELAKLRIENAQIRNELERVALDKEQAKQTVREPEVVKPEVQKLVFTIPERGEVVQASLRGNTDMKDNELKKVRAEIFEVRNELERVHLEKERLQQCINDLEQKVAVSNTDDFQKLRAKNAALHLEVERLVLDRDRLQEYVQPETVVVDRQSLLAAAPERETLNLEANEAMEKLRAEIADVRHELERVILEKDKLMIGDRDKNVEASFSSKTSRKENDELRKVRGEITDVRSELEILVLEKQKLQQAMRELEGKAFKRSYSKDTKKENNDELAKLRLEIAEVRQELERMVLDREKLLETIHEAEVAAAVKQPKLETVPSREEVVTVNSGIEINKKDSEELKRLRNEIAEVRLELERVILDKDKLHPIAPERKGKTGFSLSLKSNTKDKDDLGKVRVEIAEVRQELEGKILQNDKLQHTIRDLERKVDLQAKALKEDKVGLGELTVERDILKKEIESMRERLKRRKSEGNNDADFELERLKNSNKHMSEQIDELQRNCDRLEQTNAANERKLADVYNQLAEYRKVSVELEHAKMQLSALEKNPQNESPVEVQQELVLRSQPNLSSPREPEAGRELRDENERLKADIEDLTEDIRRKEILINSMVAPIGISNDITELNREIEQLKLDSKNDRKKLEAEIERLAAEERRMKENERRMLHEIALLRDEKRSLSMNVNSTGPTAAEIEAQKAKLRDLQNDVERSRAEWQDEKLRLMEKIAHLNVDLKTCRDHLRDSEDQCKIVGQANLKLGQDLENLLSQKENSEKGRGRTNEIEAELARFRMDIASKDRTIEELTGKLAVSEDRLDGYGRIAVERDVFKREADNLKAVLLARPDNSKRLDDLMQNYDELLAEIARLEEVSRTHEEIIAEKDKQLQALSTSLNGVTEENGRIKLDNKELIHKLELSLLEQRRHSSATSPGNLENGELIAENERLKMEIEKHALTAKLAQEKSERELMQEKKRLTDMNRELGVENGKLRLSLESFESDMKKLEPEISQRLEGRKKSLSMEPPGSRAVDLSNISDPNEQVRVLLDSNRNLSEDIALAQRRLSIARTLDSSQTSSAIKDQEYFHRKLRQYTRSEAQHAVQLRDKEELCERQLRQLNELTTENKQLNDDLNALREIVRIQNVSKSLDDVPQQLRSSRVSADELLNELLKLNGLERPQTGNTSHLGDLNRNLIDSRRQSRGDEGYVGGPNGDITSPSYQDVIDMTSSISWQRMRSALDECETEIARLHHKNKEIERKYLEIIATYRMHLLAAMQDRLEPEIREHLMRIIQLRPSSADDSSRRGSSIDSF